MLPILKNIINTAYKTIKIRKFFLYICYIFLFLILSNFVVLSDNLRNVSIQPSWIKLFGHNGSAVKYQTAFYSPTEKQLYLVIKSLNFIKKESHSWC